MKTEEYLKFHEELCNTARSLSARKNADYAAPDGGPDVYQCFRNFMATQAIGNTSVEQGFVVRLLDKLVRVSNLLKPAHEQQVKDESVRDTLLDIINYACLLAAYLEVKKGKTR